jgi:ABC-type proline/glycine betaine transport system permease subunit
MKATEIAGIARALAAGGFGILVGKGYIDQQTAADLAGAAGIIAVAVWSVWAKRKSR